MKSKTLTCTTAMALFAALAIPVQLAAQHTRYKPIDLGTLGGPASYFPGAPPVSKVLDNHGAFAGYADTSTPDPLKPPACFNQDCFVSHSFQWQNGALTDLGSLAAGWSSATLGISDTGLIVGFSQNGVIDPLTGGPEVRAFLWRDGQMIDLGTLGGNESMAAGVNSRGLAVGGAENAIPDPFSFFSGVQVRAFAWQKEAMQDLGTLGGPDAFAQVVNERGQVAGDSYTSYTPGPSGFPQVDSFLWQNGKMIDLGGLGGSSSSANDLNNHGQVVGIAKLAGDLVSHPFLWDRGVLTDLGTLGGDNGQATGVNDRGEVVGYADLLGSTSHHAFLWKSGAITDLGVLAGFSCSAAWSINPKGEIVGHSHDCVAASDAVLWENSGPPIDLNTLIPSGFTLHLQDALNINHRGEIAGFGVPPGCAPQDFETCGHAYVLIPCKGDDDGCEGESPSGLTQTHPVPATQQPTTATPTNSVSDRQPATMLDRLRARRGQRYDLPGSATGPTH